MSLGVVIDHSFCFAMQAVEAEIKLLSKTKGANDAIATASSGEKGPPLPGTCLSLCMSMCVCVYVSLSLSLCVFVYVFVCACVYLCVSVSVSVCCVFFYGLNSHSYD